MMLFACLLLATPLFIIGGDDLAKDGTHPGHPLSFAADPNLINVRDFGSVGNEVHHDTDALMRPLNYALLPAKDKKPPRIDVRFFCRQELILFLFQSTMVMPI
jgi:hypothetical protein